MILRDKKSLIFLVLPVLLFFYGIGLPAQQVISDGTTDSLNVESVKINANFTAKTDTTYATKADMVADTLVVGKTYTTQGFYSPGDDGAATYLCVPGGNGDGYINHTVNGGTATLMLQFGDSLKVNKAGFKADGETDNTPALVVILALLSNKELEFEEGTYNFIISSTIVPQGNITFKGKSRNASNLLFQLPSTAYKNIFKMVYSDLTFRDMSINFDIAAGGQFSFISQQSDNLTIENCYINGGTTDDGSEISHGAYVITFPSSGTQKGITIENSNINQVSYTFLKSNVNSSIQDKIIIKNSTFKKNYRGDINLNSPLGSINDVEISGNTVTEGKGTDIGLLQLPIALSSVTNTRITNNHINGKYFTGIHIEENCFNSIIENNLLEIDAGSGGSALSIQRNNIAGTYYYPQNITISTNIFKNIGPSKNPTNGLSIVHDASSGSVGNAITIINNISDGFEKGFLFGSSIAAGVVVKGNLATGCGVGFSGPRALSITLSGNTSKGCDIGVRSVGGVVMDHTFIECLTDIVALDQSLMVINPSWIFNDFSSSAGSTTRLKLTSIGANDRVFGVFSSITQCENSTDYASKISEITWDGTSLTQVVKASMQSGTITSAFAETTGDLNHGVYTSADRSYINAQIHLEGSILLRN